MSALEKFNAWFDKYLDRKYDRVPRDNYTMRLSVAELEAVSGFLKENSFALNFPELARQNEITKQLAGW